jgi:hypothetical protein
MGVPTLEVGYTSATTGRGEREVHKGHVVAFGGGVKFNINLHYFFVHMLVYNIHLGLFLNLFNSNVSMKT